MNNSGDSIQDPHFPSGARPDRESFVFGATSVFFVLALIALYAVSRYSFLLFHTLAEFFSIAVAVATFLIAWNTRRYIENNYLLFLGIAYLFVGFLDLLHTLSYTGMGVFPNADSDLPTQLWLAARYVEAGSLLTAPFLIHRIPKPFAGLASFTGITAVLLVAIFSGVFPNAYLPDSGLTEFKILSEYAVCLALGVSGWLLWRRRRHFERDILTLVILALFATICSELLFTFYVSVFGLSNLLGHYFKILSFYFIYLAVIHKGLTDPYSLMFRKLAEHERMLTEAQTIAHVGGWELDLETQKQRWTKESYRLHEVGQNFDPNLENGLAFFRGESRKTIEEAVTRAMTTGEAYDLELPMVTARGNTIWVRAKGRGIFDDHGRLYKIAGTIQDVTDWKIMRERLEQATEQAEAANRAKSDFLANMSHELRTPLSGILGMLSLARDNAENDQQRERIGRAITSAETLLDIINDVLDISKIEAGVLDLDYKPFDLHELLRISENTFGETARQKGLKLQVHVGEDVPRRLTGDSKRIRQVLFNLLSNALKFTESGRIRLQVERIHNHDPHAIHLFFSVSDTGPGIPENMQSTIFEKFTQAEQGKRAGGTGLGLSIVKQLVTAMGGEVHLESRVGEGTTFSFDLMLEPAEDEQAEQNERPDKQEPALPDPLKLLVAEDDETSRMVTITFLKAMGHDVTSAEDGAHVFQALDKDRYDAVLLDMHLPDMDGLDIIDRIRSGEQGGLNRDIPIIAMTGQALPDEKKAMLSSGLDGYLSKPVDPEELKVALTTLESPN